MNLNPDSLLAFSTIYEQGSFTKAADVLGLSQSALSQKLARLEEQVESTLMIRQSHGLHLTSSGERLLRYAKELHQREQHFLKDFFQQGEELAGTFRLGGFSSIVRSLVIPRLAPWMRKNPRVSIEFMSEEIIDLIPMLKRNKCDAAILDYSPQLNGFEEVMLGREEYVLIESARHKKVQEVFLDHGPHDNATESFFLFQGKKINYRRGFMGDVYGILDGVANGLGKAVMSKHLISGDKRFKQIKMPKRYFRPLILCFYQQSYYSPLHKEVVEQLTQTQLN